MPLACSAAPAWELAQVSARPACLLCRKAFETALSWHVWQSAGFTAADALSSISELGGLAAIAAPRTRLARGTLNRKDLMVPLIPSCSAGSGIGTGRYAAGYPSAARVAASAIELRPSAAPLSFHDACQVRHPRAAIRTLVARVRPRPPNSNRSNDPKPGSKRGMRAGRLGAKVVAYLDGGGLADGSRGTTIVSRNPARSANSRSPVAEKTPGLLRSKKWKAPRARWNATRSAGAAESAASRSRTETRSGSISMSWTSARAGPKISGPG